MMIAGVAIYSHGALLALLSALGAAQRISQERERRTLPALVNSPLEARRIADGKLLGAWRFTAWLACLTLPFLAIATLWGGLSAGRLLAAWSLALGLSGLFGRSLSAYLATGAALFLWCAVVPVVALIAFQSSMAGSVSEAIGLSFIAYHLPLAPQAWLFTGGFDGQPFGWVVFPVALGTWTVIAVLGRALAVRGLRREEY